MKDGGGIIYIAIVSTSKCKIRIYNFSSKILKYIFSQNLYKMDSMVHNRNKNLENKNQNG